MGSGHKGLRSGQTVVTVKCGLFLLLLIFLAGLVKAQKLTTSDNGSAGPPQASAKTAPRSTKASSSAAPNFGRDIEPVFLASCGNCHAGNQAQGHLRLDSVAAILKGGVSGAAIVPGHSQDSLLVRRLLGLGDGPRMPMAASPLEPRNINLIRAWIDYASFKGIELGAQSAAPAPKSSHQQSTAASPLFAAKIRPVLAARCYQCHGPEIHQNGLRLDSLAAILKGSENGKVVVPGNSGDSRIIRRLAGLERPQMPYGGPPLTDAQIKMVRQWIDMGAPGPDSTTAIAQATQPLKHWAYIKPVRPDLPKVKNSAWCRNPIDYFVLARLEKDGAHPSPEADKATLLRRVYLDLIGLPPTIKETDEFMADQSPSAYEKLVDKLLASPHYGERWARPWLDLSRYADSNGYEKDNPRVAWEYRDWLIKALNDDMSFKEFTIEQIAGDMLPNPTNDQLIATGFNRNTLLNQEGGVDKLEQRFYTLVDRVNTTAEVWLGTTLGCAECHNHKFDPFPQKDYYRMMAFFDSNANYKILDLGQGEGYVWEPDLELPTPEQAVKAKQLRTDIAGLKQTLATETPARESEQEKWEAEMKRAVKEWTPLKPSHYVSEEGAELKLLDDGSILAGGKNPFADTYDIEAETKSQAITGIRIEVLADPSLPKGGPGRDLDGNFFLSGFEVEASPADKSGPAQKIVFKQAVDNESESGYSARNLVKKDKDLKGWSIDSTPSPVPIVREAVLVPEKPFGFPAGTKLTIRLTHGMRHTTRNIGRFRLSVTTSQNPAAITQVPARMVPVLDKPSSERSEKEKGDLAAVFRSIAPSLQPARDQVAKLEKSVEDLGIVTALVMGEQGSFERPSTYVRIRGTFSSLSDKVFAGVPSALNPLPSDAMPNRLGLAEWLVSDDNPLTARVTVNHYWQEIFGQGIVETSEDFGTQGDPPTHPELLDWLATEFMQNNWSMKHIIRLIVASATYRQSSRATPQMIEYDPYDKLLERGPRFRVEAEMVRDIALSAAGLLSPRVGGPSVMPYQPPGIWDRPYSDAKWVESIDGDQYRRGIYIFIRRTAPYPSLTTFDVPSREFCTVRRVRTNTPLQALTTLNDPVYFEAAKALARRMMEDAGPGPAARVTYGFRRAVTRRPASQELDRIVAYYQAELGHYQKDLKAAGDVIKGYGDSKLDPAEQAAWTMVANVLLNLDETITKE
ncbi:MAG TPA: PSD1 and planctomycete cytochrome C domain-containing protein [Terriglobia bacterium]|nr:PSD1 and planctomycete cytochrome C domain-containing protein [Terriglobia bacterium]